MSQYNPDFFKPTRPSEKLLFQAGEILEDIDPDLKRELYKEFGQSQFSEGFFSNEFPKGD